jgi:hypothetical protein
LADDEQAEIDLLLTRAREIRAAYATLPRILSELRDRRVHYPEITEMTGIPMSTAQAMVTRHRASSD